MCNVGALDADTVGFFCSFIALQFYLVYTYLFILPLFLKEVNNITSEREVQIF